MSNSLPQRKSPRLPGYDYASGEAYFVTICEHQRKSILGAVIDAMCHLSKLGQIAHDDLASIPFHYQQIDVPIWIVMPNHIHAIIAIEEIADPPTLGVIVGSYKSGVTRKARQMLADIPDRLWQTSYHDHIIRNAESYRKIYTHIEQNPARWQQDTFFAR